MHTVNDHLTPELEAQLNDKSDSAKIAKMNKIIGHIKEDTNNPETIYSMGIGYYFLGEYEKCMEKEEESFPFFEDEMGIAAIFWHTLAAWRAGKEPKLLKENYHYGMTVGHHRSYNRVMAIACGNVSLETAMTLYEHSFQPLDSAIYGYGLGCYLDSIGQHEKAFEIIEKVAKDDSFWIAYAFLAAWNDINKPNIG